MTKKTELSRVLLELARMEGFPEGSSRHGYSFVAPLTADGHLDAEAWRCVKDKCVVTRFWGNDIPERGILSRVGQGWHFDYGNEGEARDEPLYKLDHHAFVPGNYVSVTEHDGVRRPFRVVSVTNQEDEP